jgi:Right handed beta helix region
MGVQPLRHGERPDHDPELSGGDGGLDAAGGLHTLVVTGDYLVVKGLKVQGATGAWGAGLYVTASADHDSIVQNELTGNQSSALFTEEGSHHIVIDRNRIHDNCCVSGMQTHGIYLQGDDQQVTNNLIYAHPNGFGIQVYDYGRRIRVVSNTVDGSRFAPIVIGGSGSGPEGTGVSDVDVVNNIGTSSPSGYGVQFDCAGLPEGGAVVHSGIGAQLVGREGSGRLAEAPVRGGVVAQDLIAVRAGDAFARGPCVRHRAGEGRCDERGPGEPDE